MHTHTHTLRPALALAAAFLLASTATSPASAASAAAGGTPADHGSRSPWTAAWTAPSQRPSTSFRDNWSEEGFRDHTLRQVVRVTAPGEEIRIRLSNRYGTSPLHITGATAALAGRGAAERPGTAKELTFGGSRSATVPVGGRLAGDPVALRTGRLQKLTVTLYLRERTGAATFHDQAYATSYRARGDRRADSSGKPFTETTQSLYYLSDVEVRGAGDSPRRKGGIVAFGDSITDGFGSTADADKRWPDQLAERLAAKGEPRPVLNSGIGGNLLLHDSSWFGDSAWSRFERDVLDKPGVGTVVLLEGLNDIGFSEVDLTTYKPNPAVSVAELIEQQRSLVRQAHRRGVEVVGATLLPMKGAEYYNAASAAKIREFNNWVRTSGEFDAVVDLNRALAAPDDPERLHPAYDSGDHKHPNDAGYGALARAVESALSA
ncbi:GDSL-like Lipase/Acylhydrolase [Streptomyces sp. YIM 130001]|uniref:SGNH/GDSL hydrolase family protein n=1 Tax=Streptomyces sp. YIM 130001 TaxID=2259644 RepID=UPI000E65397C|nr:SGNH/GDSL hydrolase family protein [Streptomyces sp. YIM 130001]RII20848.1 GDSL-like Lipase/Acylhydrolase [Streptomyces sp. YIM 130001]